MKRKRKAATTTKRKVQAKSELVEVEIQEEVIDDSSVKGGGEEGEAEEDDILASKGDEEEVGEVDDEDEGEQQQIYVIQGSDGESVSVIEGTEVVVSSGGDGAAAAAATEMFQVYEEVVLPDGSSAKLDDAGDVLAACSNSASSIKGGVGFLANTSAALLSTAVDPATGAEYHICRMCNQFVTPDMVATHNAQAHGHVRDLTCMECGKLFKSKRSLFGHRKEKHSGTLEVHSCPECGKTFGRKSNLKAHRESLHYGKKFPCIYCERIFTNRSSMNQHVKKTHPACPSSPSMTDSPKTTIILRPVAANMKV